MSTHLQEKLHRFKERIQVLQSMTQDVGEIIGIELYDFIHKNSQLKESFYQRVNYYERLVESKTFSNTQDKLYEASVAVLRCVNSEEIKKAHAITPCSYIFTPKNVPNSHADISLPDLYDCLLKKNHIYRLGDNRLVFCPSEGDLPGTVPISAVGRQYSVMESVFHYIGSHILFNHEVRLHKFNLKIQKYNSVWHTFDEQISKDPVDLHVKQFRHFFHFCTAVAPRPGEEHHFDWFNDQRFKANGHYKFKEVIDASLLVIDDLLESLEQPLPQILPNLHSEVPAEVSFDNTSAILTIGSDKCQIPLHKNEHFLCRVMFAHSPKVPVSWDEIYEQMTGYYEEYFGKPPNIRDNWRPIYDAVENLNDRLIHVFPKTNPLFSWQRKTVTRNY